MHLPRWAPPQGRVLAVLLIAVGLPGVVAGATPLMEQARAQEERAAELFNASDFKGAHDAYEAARDLWQEAGEPAGEGRALSWLCDIERKLEDLESALQACDRGLAIWRRLEDTYWQADTLRGRGVVLATRKQGDDTEQAVASYEKAIRLFSQLGEHYWHSATLLDLSGLQMQLGDYPRALEHAREALVLAEAAEDSNLRAAALRLAGATLAELGESKEALVHLRLAEELLDELGSKIEQMQVLGTIGWVLAAMDENEQAIEYYERSRQIAIEIPIGGWQATMETYIGSLHHLLGESHLGLQSLLRAVEVAENLEGRDREGEARYYLGRVFLDLGDDDRAREQLESALHLFEGSSLVTNWFQTQQEVGVLHTRQGDYPRAFESFQGVLKRAREMQDPGMEASALEAIGRVEIARGRPEAARRLLNEALAMHEKAAYRSGAVAVQLALSDSHLLSGDPERAAALARSALETSRAIGDWQQASRARYTLARAALAQGQLTTAADWIADAVASVETHRTKLTEDRIRATFFGGFQDYFDFYLTILETQHRNQPDAGYAERAFTVAQSAQARTIYDHLAGQRVDFRQHVDAELLAHESLLGDRLETAEAELASVISSGGERTAIREAEAEIQAITREQRQLATRLWAASPHYAALRFPRPLDAEEIRRQLLDPESVLLQYAVGEQQSLLWALTSTSLEMHVLPGRAELTAAASEGHRAATNSLRREARTASARAMDELGDLLLGPVAHLEAEKNLWIVPDGPLHFVPFSALTLEGTPLVKKHRVSILPSASIAAQSLGRNAGADRETAVAVIADPVFEATDPRFESIQVTVADASSTADGVLGVALRGSRLASLRRLAFSGREANTILSLVPPGERISAVGFAANRAFVESGRLDNARIIHFATHGILHTSEPELSGLVLSLLDSHGRAQPGFLRARDIYRWRLNADLVVLSACETALGKELDGEGVIGLTRAFMYAGARQVVVSLWPVSDEATAELMAHFYRGLFEHKLTPSAALRHAQLTLAATPRWSAPYYWAGFAVHGL